MTRWLDDDEMAFWRSFVEAGRLMTAISADLRAESELTIDDYEVLVRLADVPDRRIRMTELSEQVLQSPSRLTQRIDRMVDKGWVARVRCKEDKRGVHAVLTDAGFDVLAAAAPGHLESVRRHLIDRLDREQLRAGADVLRTALDGDAADA